MPQQYVDALTDIAEFVYQSDIASTALIDCGSRAVRLLMNTKTSQSIHHRTMLAVLRYRYGQAIMKSGEQSLNSMLSFERNHVDDKAQYDEVEVAMRKYGIKIENNGGRAAFDASSRRMFEVDEETKRHMAGLNDTIDVVKDASSRVQAVFIVPQKMRPGKQSAVEVHITIADGWHAYADTDKNRDEGFIPTTVEFVLPDNFETTGSQRVNPKQGHLLSGSMVIVQDFICPASNKLNGMSEFPVTAKMTYQVCDDGHCLPPVEIAAKGIMRMKK